MGRGPGRGSPEPTPCGSAFPHSRRSLRQRTFDPCDRLGEPLPHVAVPDLEHEPASILELGALACVPLHVERELARPELGMGFGIRWIAPWTPVPEAAVDEDSDLPTRI